MSKTGTPSMDNAYPFLWISFVGHINMSSGSTTGKASLPNSHQNTHFQVLTNMTKKELRPFPIVSSNRRFFCAIFGTCHVPLETSRRKEREASKGSTIWWRCTKYLPKIRAIETAFVNCVVILTAIGSKCVHIMTCLCFVLTMQLVQDNMKTIWRLRLTLRCLFSEFSFLRS